MTKSKHTPGPWRIAEREVMEDGSVYPRHIIGGSRGLTVCFSESPNIADLAIRHPDSIYASDNMIESGGDVHSKIANARLIAASPKLLKALEDAVDLLEQAGYSTNEYHAAIKEAKGE